MFFSLISNIGFVPSTYVAEKAGKNFERFEWVVFLFLCFIVNKWICEESFVIWGIDLTGMNWLSRRWYNKNITRGEAEDLLMKEVNINKNNNNDTLLTPWGNSLWKTKSVFKDIVIIKFSFGLPVKQKLFQIIILIISIITQHTFVVTVQPTMLLHLQNYCKCTC